MTKTNQLFDLLFSRLMLAAAVAIPVGPTNTLHLHPFRFPAPPSDEVFGGLGSGSGRNE